MTWLGDLGSAVFGAAYTYRVALAVGSLVGAAVLAVVARRRGWLTRIRRHPRAAVAVLVPVLAVVLPVGWYLASPLVLSATIDEPPPVVTTAASPLPTASAAPDRSAAPLPSTSPGASASAEAPSRLMSLSGPFHGSDDFHFGRGTARLIETSPGVFVVRLEGFAVRNGPDLYVYLSPNADGYADDAIELGKLKADTGNQNYTVPAGALDEPTRAASVVIWCKQFSHLFATAPLTG
ncbi:MAG TPA: DM13 domain-containing protein [Candidatus Limnocylindrales bacterium]